MRHDRLRALLNAGEPSIGTGLLSRWPMRVSSAAMGAPLTGEAGQ
jgi:hypothetical protein